MYFAHFNIQTRAYAEGTPVLLVDISRAGLDKVRAVLGIA